MRRRTSVVCTRGYGTLCSCARKYWRHGTDCHRVAVANRIRWPNVRMLSASFGVWDVWRCECESYAAVQWGNVWLCDKICYCERALNGCRFMLGARFGNSMVISDKADWMNGDSTWMGISTRRAEDDDDNGDYSLLRTNYLSAVTVAATRPFPGAH